MTMEKYVNEWGKECFRGATDETLFSADLFHEVENLLVGEDLQWALHTDIGSLTVVDRMTGFGWRDVETGYRDQTGNFWLASGGLDVRESGAATLGEAISWVKARANTCVPGKY